MNIVPFSLPNKTNNMAKSKVPVVVVDTNRYLETPINSQDGQFQIVGMSTDTELLYKYINGNGTLHSYRFDPRAKDRHEKAFCGEVDNRHGKGQDFLALAFAVWCKLFPDEYAYWFKNAVLYVNKLRDEIDDAQAYIATCEAIHGLTVDERGVSVAELTAMVKKAAQSCFQWESVPTHKIFAYSGLPYCIVKFGLEVYDQGRINHMRNIGIEVKSELGTFNQAMQYLVQTKAAFLKFVQEYQEERGEENE